MTERPKLALVVAVGPGGAIGRAGALPWHVPEDLKHFKAVTLGHAILMGRVTYDSIGKALPGRRNIVITRTRRHFPDCEVASSLEEAIALARTTDDEPRVIGGAKIYAEALPLATRIFLTEIERDVSGADAFFSFDRTGFREVSRERGTTEGVTFVTLERIES